jgi:hypothetical protein
MLAVVECAIDDLAVPLYLSLGLFKYVPSSSYSMPPDRLKIIYHATSKFSLQTYFRLVGFRANRTDVERCK